MKRHFPEQENTKNGYVFCSADDHTGAPFAYTRVFAQKGILVRVPLVYSSEKLAISLRRRHSKELSMWRFYAARLSGAFETKVYVAR
jgi:hypothetical protein